jgi:hypothetical protein
MQDPILVHTLYGEGSIVGELKGDRVLWRCTLSSTLHCRSILVTALAGDVNKSICCQGSPCERITRQKKHFASTGVFDVEDRRDDCPALQDSRHK